MCGRLSKPGPSRVRWWIQWLGLAAGPLLAAALYLLVPAAGPARATLAVMGWMATWWLTEAIDIAATALLPVVLFPLFGVAPIRAAAAPYADPLIFLFIGGFLLAISMERWGLGRRIALLVLRLAGARPATLVGAFMLVTATLSAFVSNTATTAMMVPIALGVVALVQEGREPDHLGVCLLLGIAYAASIGGLATVIGTPPNAFLVGFLREGLPAAQRIELPFARWMLIGVPLAAVFLPLVWLLLTRVLYPLDRRPIEGGAELIARELERLGPPSRGEWATFLVFCGAVAAWIAQPLLAGTSDATIAITAGLLLFVIPVDWRERTFVMDWPAASKLPWGVLILFGGGLSLAAMVQRTGVAELIGGQAARLAGLPPLVLVLAVTAGVLLLTELTSNTATAATLLPVLAAMAPGLGLHPYRLIFPAALAASCAFMLPVATPPNAIVFGTGAVRMGQMVRAGIGLNAIGLLLVVAVTELLVPLVLGLRW